MEDPSGIKKAAIVIDAYKRKVFKKKLKMAGFSFTESPGVTPDTLTLTIKFHEKDFHKVKKLITKINSQATRGQA